MRSKMRKFTRILSGKLFEKKQELQSRNHHSIGSSHETESSERSSDRGGDRVHRRLSGGRQSEEQFVYTDVEVMSTEGNEEFFLDGVCPAGVTVVLAGTPGIGKSQLARQLAIEVASGSNNFIGFGLNVRHSRAVYVTTEDGQQAVRLSITKQFEGLGKEPTGNLRFIFADTLFHGEILQKIRKALEQSPVDLVVVDSFGDVFDGSDSNSNVQMRNSVRAFDAIAKEFGCVVLLVHHINKSAYDLSPSQKHIQGGSGLVQKARLALQLTEEADGLGLQIVKGNYCSREVRERTIHLDFSDETLLFRVRDNAFNVAIGAEQLDESKVDERLEGLKGLANQIFGNKVLSYTVFCHEFMRLTSKSIATAKRAHQELVDMEFIIEVENPIGYKLKIPPIDSVVSEEGD